MLNQNIQIDVKNVLGYSSVIIGLIIFLTVPLDKV